MAAPSTSVLDSFERASLGGDWTIIVGSISIESYQLRATTVGAGYWDVEEFGPASEVFISVPVRPNSGTFVEIGLRVKDQGSVSTLDGYSLRLSNSSGTYTLTLQRIDNGSGTTLDSETVTFADGDKIWLWASGSSLKGYTGSGSTWTERVSATDATYSAAGYLTASIYGNTARLDDFGGGTHPIEAGYISSAEAVYAPTVAASAGAQTITAGYIASAEAVYEASVTPGAVTIEAGYISSAEAVYEASVTPGSVTISAGYISSLEAVYSPAIVADGAISAGYIESAEAVYAPAVEPGAVTISAGYISSEEAVYEASVTPGSVTVSAGYIASAEAVYEAAVATGALLIEAAYIGSLEAVYAPVVTRAAFVAPEDERLLAVEYESRVLLVTWEGRVLAVEYESRVLAVEADERATAVQWETRLIEV